MRTIDKQADGFAVDAAMQVSRIGCDCAGTKPTRRSTDAAAASLAARHASTFSSLIRGWIRTEESHSPPAKGQWELDLVELPRSIVRRNTVFALQYGSKRSTGAALSLSSKRA